MNPTDRIHFCYTFTEYIEPDPLYLQYEQYLQYFVQTIHK